MDWEDELASSPATTLRRVRALWLTEVLVYAGAAAFAGWLARGETPLLPTWHGFFFWLDVALLVVAVPVGHTVRMQCYKRHWKGHAVTPSGYFWGSLYRWSPLELTIVMGLVGWVLAGRPFPILIPAALAWLLILLDRPSGKPMQPDPPRQAQR